jgi:hypothetical protein
MRKGEILQQKESRMNLEKQNTKKEIEKQLEREGYRRIERDKEIKRK